MTIRVKLLVTVLVVSLATLSEAFAAETVAVHKVTVIQGSGTAPRPNQTILIRDSRIATIGDSSRVRIPRGSLVIDGSGKFAIPGLWDMHVHFRGSLLGNKGSFVAENEAMLPLYLANGVTGVREMGGDMVDTVVRWQKNISSGKQVGPRIVTCGPKLDGAKPVWPGSIPVTSVDEARAAVQRARTAGGEFTKIYNGLPSIPRDAYFAILAESKRLGLHATGHLTKEIRYVEAAAAGQDFEHISSLLRACGRSQDELAARTLAETISAFDPESAREFARSLAQAGVSVTPTLSVVFQLANQEAAEALSAPRRPYLLPRYLETWMDRPRRRDSAAILQDQYKISLQFTKILKDEGVPLLAGSDIGASNSKLTPGFSLHDELEQFVKAGLTPAEALRAATWNGAKWLGRQDSIGTLEPGKLADIVVLDANPLEDIHNTTKIRTVIANGNVFNRATLDEMLDNAARRARLP